MSKDAIKRANELIVMYSCLPRHQLKATLLHSFKEYCLYAHLMSSGVEMDWESCHETMSEVLQRFADQRNKKRNLAISVPPGSGKSIMMQYFISWCFARNKSSSFLYVAYMENLIKRLSRQTRDMIMSPWWVELFGDELSSVREDGKKVSKERGAKGFSLKTGGVRSGLVAATVLSGIIGLDCGNPAAIGFPGALILDDPNLPEFVRYPAQAEMVEDAYHSKMESRRRTPDTPTIVIMQRLFKRDFIGHLMDTEAEDWEFVVIPAILQDENGKDKSFYEKRFPLVELYKKKSRDLFNFESQYMQNPPEYGGTIFDRNDFRYYKSPPPNTELTRTFITVDLAMKKGEERDYSVFACWGVDRNNFLYLLKFNRGKWEIGNTRNRLKLFFESCESVFNCHRLCIENVSGNTAFIAELRRECPSMCVIELSRGGRQNKLLRANDARQFFEGGKVYFPEYHPLLSIIESELLSFDGQDSKNKHDDIVDVVSDACSQAFMRKSNSIYLGLY